MPADASIFNAFAVRPKSIAEYDQEYAAADDARANRQLNMLKLQGAQQEMATNAARRNYLSGADLSTSEGITGLARFDPKLAFELQGKQAEAQKNAALTGKAVADTGKAKAETAASQFKLQQDQLNHGIQAWTAASTPDQAKASIMEGVQLGYFSPEQAQATIAQLPADPQQYQALRQQKLMSLISGKDRLQLALEQQKASETARHNTASEGLTARGQNMTDSRAREGLALQREAARAQVLDTENGPVLVDKGTGMSRPVMASGGVPLPGKPSEAQKKELMSINQQRATIEGALDAVKKNPSAFSYARGVAGSTDLGEAVAGRLDSNDEAQARAYVFNNVSKVINERAGAAQSAQELQRLKGFLPGPTDNATQIANKFKGFQQYLNDMEAGTRTQTRAAAAPTTGGVKPFDADKEARYQAWKKANGQ